MLRLFLILLSSLGMELADQSKPLVTQMQRNAPSQLTGVVYGLDGEPVEGVSVVIMPNTGSPNNIKTGPDGKYQIEWKRNNVSWVDGELYVLARKEKSNLAGSVAITLDSKTADIKLAKAFSAKGKVVNEDGESLVDAKVSVMFWGDSWGTSLDRGDSKIKTDSNGEYQVSCLPQDHKYAININNVKGYGSGRQDFRTDPGIEGNVIDVDNIVLPVADQIITGKVVDEDGNGLSDVQVYLYGTGQPNKSKQTDKDGKFSFDAVCAGRASIQANYNKNGQHMYNHIETEGGAEDVVLVVSERSNYGGFVPRQPASILGQKLPDMEKYGIANPEAGKPVLLFFWDMKQRPSRHFVKQLAAKKQVLESKGVHAMLVHCGESGHNELDAWLNDNSISFESLILTKEIEDAKFKLGLKGFPWMVLTDAGLKVVAEGFSMEELEGKLN